MTTLAYTLCAIAWIITIAFILGAFKVASKADHASEVIAQDVDNGPGTDDPWLIAVARGALAETQIHEQPTGTTGARNNA